MREGVNNNAKPPVLVKDSRWSSKSQSGDQRTQPMTKLLHTTHRVALRSLHCDRFEGALFRPAAEPQKPNRTGPGSTASERLVRASVTGARTEEDGRKRNRSDVHVESWKLQKPHETVAVSTWNQMGRVFTGMFFVGRFSRVSPLSFAPVRIRSTRIAAGSG